VEAVYEYRQGFFLAVRAGTAFRNVFEGTNFQKSKNKITNKSSVSKFKEFSKLAHYLRKWGARYRTSFIEVEGIAYTTLFRESKSQRICGMFPV
jgi:hypothetical protein